MSIDTLNNKGVVFIRLFIAVNFSDAIKNQIYEVIGKVKAGAVQGNFVHNEHIHLTVEFLGEIQNSKVDLIKKAMDELDFSGFTLGLTKAGFFKRPDGNIYWIGIQDNPTLFNLQQKLHHNITQNGFVLEDRPYKPHITIGRKVVLRNDFYIDEINNLVGKIKIDINKIDLMKSEFKYGRLIHTLIYSKPL